MSGSALFVLASLTDFRIRVTENRTVALAFTGGRPAAQLIFCAS